MSNVICLMNVDADRATFTWSEGPASFEPYTLDGMVYKDFQEIAAEAREKLADLVKDYLFDEQNMPKSAFALAEAGHELYQAVFDPGAEQARQARQVRKWLEELAQQHEVDTLEIVVESPWSLPWNVIYDREPDKEAFLSGDERPDRWKPFWGLRYNLAGGRKVDPLRRMPLLSDPKVLLVVDPEIRDGLPEPQQKRLADFAEQHAFKTVHNKDELQEAVNAERPELLYWLSHAEPDALVLAGEPISPRNMRKLLRPDDDESFGGLAFLNACQTAEGGASGSFFEAFHSVGFAGMIGTEHQTVDQFANPLGLDFLEAFLDRGEPVGSALRNLRGRVPLGLLYGTYCPPDIRVDCGDEHDSVEVRQVFLEGVALGAVPAADETAARVLPPLPDEPYRSLAYYDREDRALFAGRDDDIERFATYLDDASTRILVLHGESGVGKSSFLRAGVIPYLEEECLGYRFVRERQANESAGAQGSVIFVRATNDLHGQLAWALCEFCARPYEYQTPLGEQVSADLPGVLRELVADEASPTIVRAVLRSEPSLLGRIMAAINDRLPFSAILVIDQGEEVFTLAQTPEDQQRGRRALDMLRRTVGASGDFKVIVCLRTEYYGRVIDRLRRGLYDTGGIREYLLTDFDEQALNEAIRRPTADEAIPYTSDVPFEKYGFRYAEGVAEEIAHRVVRYTTQRRDSVLPLLQAICAQLYRLARQRDDGTITLDDLKKLGGIEGGMRHHVEGLLGELLKGRPLDRRPVQKLFTQLYLRQPDGTLTTALLAADEVERRWTGRMPFDRLLRFCCTMRLLKVNTLRIGMEEERRYVSLGHDALAKLAAQWEEELTRQERVRRTLKKAAAWAAAAVVVLLMVGSIVAWNRHNNEVRIARNHADDLVKRIESATPAELPNIIRHELPAYRRWADPQLRLIAGDESSHPAQRLRASLALIPVDDSQAGWLRERLLDCDVYEFSVIRDSLKPPSDELLAYLWRKLRDAGLDIQARFYAGMALAEYAPQSTDWSDADYEFLADQLVSANVDYQDNFRSYLTPVKQKLLQPLEEKFLDTTIRDSANISAANALADFATDDAQLLARLACEATPEEYAVIYEKLKAADRAAVEASLIEIAQQQPDAAMSQRDRVHLGVRRAGAAITLVRFGNHAQALRALHVTDYPETLTQFVHRCQERGVRPQQLVECLPRTKIARDDTSGPARKMEERVLFGLLLALGEFSLDELPEQEREPLVKQLADWYSNDPASAIHGACGWLLRQWEQDSLARKVDQTPVAYDPNREWYTVRIEAEAAGGGTLESSLGNRRRTFYMTFIVFSPGEYEIGSPELEPKRDSDETRHTVRITRPFSILDREITREEFEAFGATFPDFEAIFPDLERTSPSPHHAMSGPNWHDAVRFCRWLTTQAGLSEQEQAYADPQLRDEQRLPIDPDRGAGAARRNWPLRLDRPGFRLPTEAEWEIACRGGSGVTYGFGGDTSLLSRYGWFADNSNQQAHVRGFLRPNLRGLFDMHGNVHEWCHDGYGVYAGQDAKDPLGQTDATARVVRGGCWAYGARFCRAANRYRAVSGNRHYSLGFRVAAVPPGG